MATPGKFLLPSPNFGKKELSTPAKPHYLTPSGMTCMKARDQPPPMYGKRGATTPAKFLQQYHKKQYIAEAPLARAYCEACDMELQSEDDLRRHCAQHENCPIEGCKYRGHASVMDKHVVSLHASGLFDKFKKLSTPEEIAAWREERRRKYPSVANVLLRQRAQEQRQRRGERLEANKNRFGKYEDRQRAQAPNKNELDNATVQARKDDGPRGKRREKRVKRRKIQEERKLTAEAKEAKFSALKDTKKLDEEAPYSCCGITMFKGTGQLKEYGHAKSKKQTENALSSLLGMYGSDDDDDEEEDEVKENAEILEQETTLLVNEEVMDTEKSTINAIYNISTTQTKHSAESETENTPKISKKAEECTQPEATTLYATIYKTETEYQTTTTKVDNTIHENTASVDSDDAAPEEAPIAHSSNLPLRTDKSKLPAQISVGLTQPSKVNDNVEPTQKRIKCAPKEMLKRKSGLNYRKAYLRKQNTMLEKLLEPDIRHERNVLLQCVRYVCENNFFGIGQENKSTEYSL